MFACLLLIVRLPHKNLFMDDYWSLRAKNYDDEVKNYSVWDFISKSDA